MQSCASGFRRQTTKGAAPQSVHVMALKKRCQAVKQCPGLAPPPPVQSSPPDSAKTNREGRCEEERLVNNFPFSVRGLERSRVGQMLLKWEGKGLLKGEGQSAVAVPCSRSSWCQRTGGGRWAGIGCWEALAQLMEGPRPIWRTHLCKG